jgi:hypothetical protein
MDVLINVKSSHNISKWQMGFNSAFKGLIYCVILDFHLTLEQCIKAFKVENSSDQVCPTVFGKSHIR